MKPRSGRQRRLLDHAVKLASGAASLVGLVFLGWILFEVIARGGKALSLGFFTREAGSPVSPGGMANAIVGTAMITALATVIGVPIGILAGTCLAEFGQRSRLATLVRFLSNTLMGVPSIIIGIFVYTILVRPFQFSGFAGGVALAIIMLPVITQTTEEMLNLVPNALRESALALGAPRWKATVGVVFRAARGGLLTGGLLAVARVSGETAPLLFTAFNSPYWPTTLFGPTPSLTVTIYNFASSGFQNAERIAWGGALVITLGILCLTIVARAALHGRTKCS